MTVDIPMYIHSVCYAWAVILGLTDVGIFVAFMFFEGDVPHGKLVGTIFCLIIAIEAFLIPLVNSMHVR